MACNSNIQHKDNTVIKVPAGARVGAWWQHEIGGPSGPNDQDNPIAASHKGMFSPPCPTPYPYLTYPALY